MPSLNPDQWSVLRAEWETGAFTNRALAQKWGVDESAIRKRARDAKQEGGAWNRDPDSLDKIHERATIRTLRSQSAEGADELAAVQVRNDPVTREELRERIIDSAAEVLAVHTEQHLGRLEKAKGLADRMAEMLTVFLGPVPPGLPDDPRVQAVVQARTEAAERLLAGRTDSVGGGLQALMRMLESIQKQTRIALGAEDRPKKMQLSGPDGGPVQTETVIDFPDLSSMPTEKLALVYQAVLALESGCHALPGFELPYGVEAVL